MFWVRSSCVWGGGCANIFARLLGVAVDAKNKDSALFGTIILR